MTTPQPKKILLVLGFQRSGTNALRRSLSLNPYVIGFNEHRNNAFYENWRLKPEPAIRELLVPPPFVNLFKPNMSVMKDQSPDFYRQFEAHQWRAIWIVRNPIDVYHSIVSRWKSRANLEVFLRDWNACHQGLLEAWTLFPDRIRVLDYDVLTEDKGPFVMEARRLNRFFGLHELSGSSKGESLFRPNGKGGVKNFPSELQAAIAEGTQAARASLDALFAHGDRRAPVE